MGVVADEQVGKDARGLPQHEQQVHIIGEHESVHRAREGEQHRGKPPQAGLVIAKVRGAIHEHEAAHPGHNEREHPRKSVHAHVERKLQLLDPHESLNRMLSLIGREREGRVQQSVDERPEWDEGCDPENPGVQNSSERHERESGHRKHRQDDKHASSLGVGGSARG